MTSIETGPTWLERLNPRNWTLTWKLVAVGLVPALLALVLGVLRVSDQAGEAADLGRSSRLLEVQEQVATAADALRQERDEATLFVAGNRTGDRGVLEIGFGQADAELDEMLAAVRGASELSATTVADLQQVEAGLGQLPLLRTDTIENPAADAEQVGTRYSEIIEDIDVLDRALLRQLRTPDIAGLADALTAVTSATEQLARQHTVLGVAIRANRVSPVISGIATSTDLQLTADFREYQAALTADQFARFGNFLDDAANAQRERLAAAILASPPNGPVTVPASEWDTAYNGSRAAADRSADLLRNELVAASVAAEEQASNLAGVNSVILMLGLLVGITIAVLIARALIRSLRVLRTSALDVAERRLPQAVESMRAGESPDVAVAPVPLSGRDEVAQVARAFDAVHGQAVRLAADQAALQANVSAMFVNLSRRSQALVERQLQLIEQLESNEQDADQLSNLFQLDHLATRMRRNSENLLVLAGTDLAKRNVAPVPLVDVLRAAVSEIEQYPRIVVQTPPTATVVGRAASDLVHLLAELLDNATNFSPPDSQVVMSTARAADGSIIIEIADRGVGMADHELSDANQRLGGPSSVDVSASRRMGLFVVGRLGARHGVNVRLSTSAADGQAAGLTASVTVPTYLIPSSEPADAGRPMPARAGAPGLPQQRLNRNSNGRPGSLSALVAGADGPVNPASVFDSPATQDGAGGQLFSPPPGANGSGGSNGSLPSRRPGSSLRPDGPPRPPEQGPGDRQGADQPERTPAEQAREVAEQARRDQEAAAARAAEATGQDTAARNGVHPAAPTNGAPQNGAVQNGTGQNGTVQNGAVPAAPLPRREPRTVDPAPAEARDQVALDAHGPQSVADEEPAAAQHPDDAAAEQEEQAAVPGDADEQAGDTADDLDGSEADEQAGDADEVAPADGNAPATPDEPGADAHEQHHAAQDEVPPAPPTTPMYVVGRGPAPQQAQQPAQQQGQRPFPQAPAQPDRPAAGPVPPAQPQQQPEQQPQQGDALFAPNVPVIAEPGIPVGRAGSSDTQERFQQGETTPIFEEIASAWFRSNRPIPVNWQTEQGGGPRQQPGQPPVRQPAPAPAPKPKPSPAPAPVEQHRPPAPAPAAPPAPEPDRPAQQAPEQAFATAADEGWRAANGSASEPAAPELTAAGLPKRRPRARLVPGSAGSAVLAPPVSSARNAENIRGRLASYQQGVRQGRESRLRGGAGAAPGANGGSEPANAGGNHDEESS
ncbi:sensor histidine kinase [Pseudonocardia nigra]|uniref:sensor histidine kinase n=1 Tax=Pseudonocardia nigra TaxID=1921578 RepID=UPI001C5D5C49|nr:nitrate- and nitrite sensing domain-containing protein [Pseudonocardia nigra]